MRLVLDANEYIYSLGLGRIPACVELLSFLSERREHDVRVIRTIVDEVVHNTLEDVHSVFYGYLRTVLEEGHGVDETFLVPFALCWA
jgi:hypothetical protein